MKTSRNFNFKGKRALVRCDFNVPLSEKGEILDDFRIKVGIPTIKYLIKKRAKIILISHLGRPEGKFVEDLSLEPIKERLEKYLKKKIFGPMDCLSKETEDFTKKMKNGEILILENIRFYKGETENDEDFSKNLAKLGDVFLNDAFSVCHRDQASVSGITKFLPFFAGPNLISEIENLSKILKNPKRPLIAIIGGKKVEDKAKAIEKFSEISDFVLVGNLVADEIKKRKVKVKNLEKIIFPIMDEKMLDLDERTIENFKERIKTARTIFWAGPLGKIEEEKYQNGTLEIAKAIIESKAFSVVGGGETLEFLNKFSLLDKFSFVSTGGGAMLDFLAGEKMPGIVALKLWK